MNPAELANQVFTLTQRVDALAHTLQNLQSENRALQDLVALSPNLPHLPLNLRLIHLHFFLVIERPIESSLMPVN